MSNTTQKPHGQRITTPGKFEGELDYVSLMWEQSLNGFVQDVGNLYFVTLDSIDALHHSGLYGAKLWEDGNGFVHSVWYDTLEEFQCAVTEAERVYAELGEDAEDY